MRSRRGLSSPTRFVLIAGLAAGLAAAGVAIASSSGTIKGCVNKSSRVLTVPKNGKCPKGSSALTWNVTGPRGPQGFRGNPGQNGQPGLSASGNESSNPGSPTTLSTTTTDTTVLSAEITLSGFARIEAAGGGTFQYSPSANQEAELDCGLTINNGNTVGNTPISTRYQEDFSGAVAYKEPAAAGGAAVEPAGTYTVAMVCHNDQLVGTPTLKFQSGDLNLLAAAP